MDQGSNSIVRSFLVFVLASIFVAGSQEKQQPVFLNHLYLVVDKGTFRKMKDSQFLKDTFASVRNATIQADSGQTWTGFYIFGKETYLEVFETAPNTILDNQVFSLAFGVDHEGDLSKLKKNLISQHWQLEERQRTRFLNNANIPWFNSVEIQYSERKPIPFRTWIMEYNKSYMNDIVQKALGRNPEDNITRRLYNARIYDATKQMQDIREVGISLQDEYYHEFLEVMQKLGYQVFPDQKGKIICQGKDFRIVVTQVPGINKVIYVQFGLNSCAEPEREYWFGERNKLIVNCNTQTATWIF